MTIKKALVTPCLALFLGAASTAAAAPPVKVEVVIDEEDEEDFFVEESSQPKTKVQQIKENADALFDELEREEIAHGKRQRVAGKEGQQKSNQVVNVIVMGEKQKTTPDVPEVPSVPDRPLTKRELRLLERKQRLEERLRAREMRRQAKLERAREKLRIKRQKLELKRQKLALKQEYRELKLEHRGWWNRPSWASSGDLLVHGKAGFNGLGAFGGVGAEFMASDVFGLRVGATFAHVDRGDADRKVGPNFDFSEGGVWANRGDVDDSLESGRAQLLDTSLAFHVIPESRFDIYPNVGFGYMGYQFEYDGHQEKGGAGYLRVGAGFNIVIKRFYGGLDFGWYPYELFRHGGGGAPVARSQAGLRSSTFGDGGGAGSAPTAVQEEGGGRFDPQRMTLTAHVGLRF